MFKWQGRPKGEGAKCYILYNLKWDLQYMDNKCLKVRNGTFSGTRTLFALNFILVKWIPQEILSSDYELDHKSELLQKIMEEKCERESPHPIPGYKYGFYTFPFMKCFSFFRILFIVFLALFFFFLSIFLLISLISLPNLISFPKGGGVSKNIHYESGEILKTGSGAKLTESATLP